MAYGHQQCVLVVYYRIQYKYTWLTLASLFLRADAQPLRMSSGGNSNILASDAFPAIGSSIEQLNRVSLRGSQGTDTPTILTEVEEVIAPHLNALIDIKEKMITGDKEGAGSALKLLLREDNSFEHLKDIKGVDIPALFELASIRDISNAQITESVPLEVINALVDHGQGKDSLVPV